MNFSLIADELEDLIDACRGEKRLSDAEPTIQHVIEVQGRTLGERDPSIAATLLRLADLYQEEGDSDKSKYAEALPLYQRALEIRQTSVGLDDPRLTDILAPYATLLRKMHRDSEAAAMQARSDPLDKEDKRNKPADER